MIVARVVTAGLEYELRDEVVMRRLRSAPSAVGGYDLLVGSGMVVSTFLVPPDHKGICKEQDDERTDTINGQLTPTT